MLSESKIADAVQTVVRTQSAVAAEEIWAYVRLHKNSLESKAATQWIQTQMEFCLEKVRERMVAAEVAKQALESRHKSEHKRWMKELDCMNELVAASTNEMHRLVSILKDAVEAKS